MTKTYTKKVNIEKLISDIPRLSPVKKPAKLDYKKYFHSMTSGNEETPQRASVWQPFNYWFIGDIHGNFAEYKTILEKIRKIDADAITIQVGDLELDNPSQINFLGEKDFFIHGNHDDVDACQKHPNFLGKFGYKHGIFYISGAKSNHMGYAHEELTVKELNDAIELYEKIKPEIVVSHDCPQSMREYFFYEKKKTFTSDALQEMWDIHAPKTWMFGHHHSSQHEVVDGTDFMCVAPVNYRQLRLVWASDSLYKEQASQPIEMTAGKILKRMFS